MNETIDICLSRLFIKTGDTVLGLPRIFFKTLLELSVFNSFCGFNGKFYKQIEGLGMGLPLGPTFANICMCFHESPLLADCSSDFRPIFYKRYIDDIFMLLKHNEQALSFLDYLNNKYPNKLPLLDCSVCKVGNRFECSVFRKPTFSGLGMSFFSYCTFRFKLNCVWTLMSRA